jgi:hypothetical protein
VKKVVGVVVVFFNTKFQPSLLCYKGKSNYVKQKKKKVMAVDVAFFVELRCSVVERRRRREAAPMQLPLFLPTVDLCYNVTSQQEEGGVTAVQLHRK